MGKKTILALGVLNIFGLGITLYLGMQYADLKKDTESKIRVNSAKIQDYKVATKTMTLKKYDQKTSDYIVQKNIDLNKIEGKLTKDLTEGFTQAYNDTHTKEEFENLKNELPNKIGYLLASKVLNIASPTISQAGEIPSFDKLNSINISYGPYNIQKSNIDILIFIDYNVPENLVQTTDGSSTISNINKKAMYKVTYNVEKREYSNLQYNELGGRDGNAS